VKPLLVIPPAPARWPALRDVPIHSDPLWQDDLEKRFAQGVPRSQDAFALMADGGLVLAFAGLSKRHDIGVVSRLFVRPEHRGHGYARRLLETLVAWFDMTGGKWLYGTATADLAEGLMRKLGFKTIRRAPRTPHDAVVVMRLTGDIYDDPLATADGRTTVHDVARANWPTMVVLLHNRPGPDPRISLDESAVTADQTALELVAQQEAGKCLLKAAFRGTRLIALGTVAVEHPGERTYAMIMPHSDAPPILREALLDLARTKGYSQVDFPMEALAAPEVSVVAPLPDRPAVPPKPPQEQPKPQAEAPPDQPETTGKQPQAEPATEEPQAAAKLADSPAEQEDAAVNPPEPAAEPEPTEPDEPAEPPAT
jgi:GNAT superfamily N-acetyltransferase